MAGSLAADSAIPWAAPPVESVVDVFRSPALRRYVGAVGFAADAPRVYGRTISVRGF